jgi:predicted nucleic acid-binding Zn ribbon protein
VRELLAGVAGEVARTTGSTAALGPVWDEAVGPQVARNVRPVSFDRGALLVEAQSQHWADALLRREDEIRARLKPQLDVAKLVVKVKG